MRKKVNSQIEKQYHYDEKSKSYLIEVSLDDYNDVYDDWDPSPFKRRDIEDEFNDFIFNSSEDIPIHFGLIIALHLIDTKQNINKENALISAYKNYYSYAVQKIDRTWSNIRKKTLFYLFFSLLLLSIGYFYGTDTENVVLNVVNEGIFIGGWVFLWEFFTNIFITRREIQTEYKLYKRLYESEIRFIYSN